MVKNEEENVLLVASFLEDRRMKKQYIIRSIFLGKMGGEGYKEASFSLLMHTNCELNVLKTTLPST